MFARPGGDDAITEVYSVPDDARYLEPDLVRDQRALATAMVPDENPAREPAVRFDPRGWHPHPDASLKFAHPNSPVPYGR
ncbi:hypothetical protein [Streptomyces anulatus]|uniref:hypothetical protein n=1 Tax=Streptomyces anulatus TaxID=1892 RepID=UPI003868DFD1|nr:hypothetical protein OG536_30500 [Streptomyces anulatus]